MFVNFMNSSSTNWNSVLNNSTFTAIVNDAPKFKCAEYTGVQIINWKDLKISDVANKARSGGVDTHNIDGISDALQKGYRVTELPPIVIVFPNGEKQLWDGYNRFNACVRIGCDDFPFLVYRLNLEWADKVEDAYDIISLSSNNHAIFKRHTISDFVNRGIDYCERNGGKLTKGQILDWVDQIENSFTKEQIQVIVDAIYQRTTIAVNILPYPHPTTARAKIEKIHNNVSSPNIMPVAICAKNDTYIQRGFHKIMENYVNDVSTDVYIYTKGCETAEAVMKQRQYAAKKIKEFDDLAFKYVVKRMTERTDAYKKLVAVGQLIDMEDLDSIVEIE